MSGYIRIPRSLLRNPLWLDMPPAYQHVFMVLIDHAVFIPTKHDDHGHMIELQPGQFCGSHADILRLCGKWVSLIEVERAIKKLILCQFVRCEVRYRKSVISIIHKDTYDMILESSEVTSGVNLRYASQGEQLFPSSPPPFSPPLSPSTPIPPLLSPPTSSHLKKERSIAQRAKSAAPLSAKTALTFNFETFTFEGINEKDVEDWKKLYPYIDLEREILAAAQWLKNNPSRSNKKLWGRYLCGWLGRENDKSENRKAYQSQNKPAVDRRQRNSDGTVANQERSLF